MNLTLFIILAITISSTLLLISHIIPNRNIDINKNSPYECGFDPINSARLPFSFRFFLIAILFLIFDLEIALLFPILPCSNNVTSTFLIHISLFFLILVIGLIYEWLNGGLEWAE